MSEAPSLFGDHAPVAASARGAAPPVDGGTSLLDLLYDGFFMLFLLKRGSEPENVPRFLEHIKQFLTDFERGAKKMNVAAEDVFMSKFAFCAAIDECVLASSFSIRDEWERRPLQLVLFGEQLAGENVFRHLEDCRAQGAVRLRSLEVFHMCLLLGFQGKYLLEGPERLAYLTARLGDEIAGMKGRRPGFAPHWALPDRIEHTLKFEAPLWSVGAVFLLIGIIALSGLQTYLRHTTTQAMAPYVDLVKVAPRQASLTITLP